jgi:hypothetical protein
MRFVVRICMFGFLTAAQAFAGIPYGGYRRFGGYRGGYGYRYGSPFYGRAGWYGGPRWGWGPGFFVPVLPFGCLTLSFGGVPWYYGGGTWYQSSGAGFVVAIPPVGIVIQTLPPDCSTVQYGGVTYFCANNVYYTALPSGQGYGVVAPPPGTIPPPSQPAPGSPDAAALDALVITPEKGQDPARLQVDRLDAQRYAANRTGYDPAQSDPTDPGTPRARQAYLKNLKSYLSARGYAVQ